MKLMENLCRYIFYTGCPKQKFAVGVLDTESTFWLNFHSQGYIRNLYTLLISRHSFYITLYFIKYKIDFPDFSNFEFLHIIFIGL